MKKLLLILVVAILTTSCEKKLVKESEIIGKWNIISSQSADGEWHDFSSLELSTIFKENGTMTFYSLLGEGKSGTWEYKKNVLTEYYDGDMTVYEFIFREGNNATLQVEKNDGTIEKYKWVKEY